MPYRVQKTLLAPLPRGQRMPLNFEQVPPEEMCDDLLSLMAEQEHDVPHGNAANNGVSAASGDARGVADGGRQRKRKKEFDARTLFANDAHVRDFSVTISALKRHVPFAWYSAFCNFSSTFGVKGSISLERGDKEEHLHVQVRLRASLAYALQLAVCAYTRTRCSLADMVCLFLRRL